MARRRDFVRGASAIRSARTTSWFEIQPVTLAQVAGGGGITHSLTALELAKRPFTIVRTHLTVHLTSDQLAVDELQFGAVGMCVVSDQASAIGVTAVPTPVTDADSDLWFLHQYMAAEFAFVSGVGFDAAGGHTYLIDSKAARKVNNDEDVLIIAELAGGISNGLIWTIAGRLLIKEH